MSIEIHRDGVLNRWFFKLSYEEGLSGDFSYQSRPYYLNAEDASHAACDADLIFMNSNAVQLAWNNGYEQAIDDVLQAHQKALEISLRHLQRCEKDPQMAVRVEMIARTLETMLSDIKKRWDKSDD